MADRDRWTALGGAIVVHLVLFAVLGFGLTSHKEPVPSSAVKPVIQARAVTEAEVFEPQRKRQAEEEAKRRRIEEQERQAAEAERQAEAEKQREVEEAARRKAAEQKRQAELKKKREAEKARLAEQERKRKIEAERKAEEARKQAEAERKRLEEKKRREAEERLKAQLEAEKRAEAQRLAQEQQRRRAAQLDRLQQQYVLDIANKVQRSWLRPLNSRGSYCRVLINQLPGGDIVGVRVTDCDGDTPFQRSVEAAVRKASPLPRPPEPELFQREIEFIFRPGR